MSGIKNNQTVKQLESFNLKGLINVHTKETHNHLLES